MDVYRSSFEFICLHCIASVNETYKIVIKSSLVNYQKRLSEDRLSTICHHSKTEFIGTRSSGWENKMLVVRYRNIAEKLR